MRCAKVRKLMIPYQDKELAGGLTLRLKEHLCQCGSCRKYAQDLRKLDSLLESQENPQMPQWLYERIMHQVKTHEPQRQSFRRRWKLQTVPITLALLLSLYAGTLIGVKTFTIGPIETATETESIAYGETSLYGLAYLNGDHHE